MGTGRRQKISDAGICRLYAKGQPRYLIGLAAGLHDAEVVEVLVRNGVRLRTQEEARELAQAARCRTIGRLKLKAVNRNSPGEL
jgi:hypothetical protein